MKNDFLLSIIVPVFNEEANIEELCRQIFSVLGKNSIKHELIFVNDGSTDNTLEKLKSAALQYDNVTVIDFSRNFGHEIASAAGFRNSKGDCAVILDGDLQDPPELIPQLISKWQEGYDVVYAKRSATKENILKKITSFFFYRIFIFLTKLNIPKDTGDFRLVDRKIIDVFNKIDDKNRFNRALFSWIGYKQAFVEFNRSPRYLGETKYNFFKLVKLSWDSVISFSTFPIRLVTYFGFILSIISFFSIIFLIFFKIYGYTVRGWTSLIMVFVFIGGIQMFILGVIGEYIGRIVTEVQKRPLYVINQVYKSKNLDAN